MSRQIQQLEQYLDQKIQTNVPLAPYTTFKIGGPAKYFFIAKNNEDLVRLSTFAKKLKIQTYVLSGCSNVLAADSGFDGLIILNKAKDIVFKKDNRVVADAGVWLMDLVDKTIGKGLLGLENLVGIPGSVGGAIRGNAGAYGSEISDCLIGVEVMRGSKQFVLNKDKCKFKYRDSVFKRNNDLIISAEFQLQKGDKEKAKTKVKEILQKRNNKLPMEYPSAGCVFQNILINSENIEQIKNLRNLPPEYLENKKVPAAWLIESLDLKGKTIGKSQVSNKHANFIINLGGATANQVLQLISYIKMKVRDELGVQLMEEIEYVGF
ncbi:MAG TPA: UDP-N-acetylmuramate dehydrogenase [Candidatus Uhrbacteria bacterium]|nr:UDP-N-acetylmuramate dehydrogenase [Candidatus Uhrbacteria bacterium]